MISIQVSILTNRCCNFMMSDFDPFFPGRSDPDRQLQSVQRGEFTFSFNMLGHTGTPAAAPLARFTDPDLRIR